MRLSLSLKTARRRRSISLDFVFTGNRINCRRGVALSSLSIVVTREVGYRTRTLGMTAARPFPPTLGHSRRRSAALGCSYTARTRQSRAHPCRERLRRVSLLRNFLCATNERLRLPVSRDLRSLHVYETVASTREWIQFRYSGGNREERQRTLVGERASERKR